ncbi:MAG TPA: hypothetical protein VHE35_08505 [Kofleriaceae bacterium]|nr:hypothetical protein [Kofleriaceae bacterium]
MSDDKEKLGLAHGGEEAGETREVYLREGRTLTVSSEGAEELVEIRAASGQVEVRIRLTEQGPVLQLEAVRMKLKAAEAVEVETKQFSVKAEQSVALASDGELTVTSTGETRIEAEGDVRVVGKTIHLN